MSVSGVRTRGLRTDRGKRAFDLLGAMLAFVATSPILGLSLLAVWLTDRRHPLYVSMRVGMNDRPFRFLKIRTMVTNAASTAVDTTLANDPRITRCGRYIRALKLDELPQLLHVIAGQMSLIGPRPNVPRETALYTATERKLLTVRPGITDIASIVFSDMAESLSAAGVADANIGYNQLIRPWKSRLSLHYIGVASRRRDALILLCTISVLFARRWTLRRLSSLLRRTGATEDLCEFVLRRTPLIPLPPPGASEIVMSRSLKEPDGEVT
ncbi:MAG: sugar transferase [Steroidobacteraceae bacterium]